MCLLTSWPSWSHELGAVAACGGLTRLLQLLSGAGGLADQGRAGVWHPVVLYGIAGMGGLSFRGEAAVRGDG